MTITTAYVEKTAWYDFLNTCPEPLIHDYFDPELPNEEKKVKVTYSKAYKTSAKSLNILYLIAFPNSTYQDFLDFISQPILLDQAVKTYTDGMLKNQPELYEIFFGNKQEDKFNTLTIEDLLIYDYAALNKKRKK